MSACQCHGCNQTCYRNPQGGYFDYCGRTCASRRCSHSQPAARAPPSLSWATPTPTTAPSSSAPQHARPAQSGAPLCTCQGCNKPCYSNGRGGFFDYCGRTCSTSACGHKKPTPTCACQGCQKPVYANPAGGFFDFCGRTCGSGACGHTRPQKLSLQSSGLLSDHAGGDIQQQFSSKWLHRSACPTIVKVLRINMPSGMRQRFTQYQEGIHASHGQSIIHGKGGPGNTHRRFHGTNLKCDLGLNSGNYRICSTQGCSVCSILKKGFLLQHSNSKHGWGRFGRGLYFSSTSSKSGDYCEPNSQGLKAMFVVNVVVGRGHKLLQDSPHLTSAPHGCHSVLGEVGHALNYDEVVTYTDSSALPLYLILFR